MVKILYDLDDKFSDEEIVTLGTEEVWNKDEYSWEGYMALKQLFFKLMVPKEHWNDITFEKFQNIVKDKYQKRINEEI